MMRAQDLLLRAVDRMHNDLHGLTRRLPNEGYEDRRALIHAYVHSTRRTLAQLLALLDWLAATRAANQTLAESALLTHDEAHQVGAGAGGPECVATDMQPAHPDD